MESPAATGLSVAPSSSTADPPTPDASTRCVPGANVLGRNADCDVLIDDGRVSGQHAFLFIRAEDASSIDVSSNGSIVNGAVVHGEQIVLQNRVGDHPGWDDPRARHRPRAVAVPPLTVSGRGGMSMHRTVIMLAGLLAALLVGAPAAAADNGLTVLAAPPASNGRMRLQVEVTEPSLQKELRSSGASPDRFRVAVEQAGAQVKAVARMADSPKERRYTVLAFDQSRSFSAYWPQAFELAKAYSDELGARSRNRTVAVMTFGKSKSTHCEETTAAGLRACLERVQARGTTTSSPGSSSTSSRRCARPRASSHSRAVAHARSSSSPMPARNRPRSR